MEGLLKTTCFIIIYVVHESSALRQHRCVSLPINSCSRMLNSSSPMYLVAHIQHEIKLLTTHPVTSHTYTYIHIYTCFTFARIT